MARTQLSRMTIACAALLALAVAGCKVSHIKAYVPKQRDYKSPVTFEDLDRETTPGSLFSPTHAVSFLVTDHRAVRMGDIVTVRVSERADAQRGASTDLSRASDTSLKISAFLGLMSTLGAVLDNGDELLHMGGGSTFRGEGTTSRSEKLEATVPALVRMVMPNGNLFIEGHRVVLVNSEEHHFYISGLIRPVDIGQDNSVASHLIADAEIEFTGRGVISEKLDPPWLQRGLDFIRPF